MFEGAASRTPDAPFISWIGGEATYGHIASVVQQQAILFAGAGAGPGTRIGVCLRNRPELVIVWFAALTVGAVPVFLDPETTATELDRIVDDLELAVVVHEASTASPRVPSAIVDSRPAAAAIVVPPLSPVPHPHDSGASIILTSGSTGRPKYVEVPHDAYVLKGLLNALRLGHRDVDRFLAVMPLFHVGGQCETLFPAIAAGASVVLSERFSASEYWTVLRAHSITMVHSTSSIWHIALARDDGLAVPKLRTIVSSLRDDLVASLNERLPTTDIVTLYGLTECPLGTLSMRGELSGPTPLRDRPAGYVGLPYGSRYEFRVLDRAGLPVGDGVEGELLVRNAGCAVRYIGEPLSTLRTTDGWVDTGDLATFYGSRLTLTGRTKDLIRRGDENISPVEVEQALRSHPRIVEVAVVAYPDRVRGEEVRAFVQVADGGTLTEGEIREHASQLLAPHKVPRYIDRVVALPRTGSNKLDKVKLRNEWKEPGWDASQPD